MFVQGNVRYNLQEIVIFTGVVFFTASFHAYSHMLCQPFQSNKIVSNIVILMESSSIKKFSLFSESHIVFFHNLISRLNNTCIVFSLLISPLFSQELFFSHNHFNKYFHMHCQPFQSTKSYQDTVILMEGSSIKKIQPFQWKWYWWRVVQ